jgi:WD40 repeat protein
VVAATGVATARALPYVGPRPFTRTDSLHGRELYGREVETESLFNLLISQRIVLLYSPSGAGKTSLIEAKLVPRLEEEGLAVLPTARVGLEPPPAAPATPDANRYLRSALSTLGGDPSGGGSLDEFLDARRRGEREPQLLILDQFEELLIEDPTDRRAKDAFFRQLGAALRDRRRWALVAMREEYVAGLDPFLRHIPDRFAARFRLDLLGEQAASSAITEPAAGAGVDFAPVADKLVRELSMSRVQRPDGVVERRPGPYVEPVQLQVVCLRIWEHLAPDATRIEESDVEAVGDVDDALAGYYAERVAAIADRTGLRERAIREWVDARLITRQGVRGQVLQGVEHSEGLSNRAIEALVDAHLVRAERRRGLTWFELAHDRLIEPIHQDNAAWFRRTLSRWQLQAAEWERLERPANLLLQGRALREAERSGAQQAGALTGTEREFLTTSRDEEGRKVVRRLVRIVSGVAAAALVAACAAVALALSLANYAKVAQAKQLASTAQAWLATDPELSLSLAIEATGLNRAPETELALRQAALESHARFALRGHDDVVWSAAYSPDGSRLATVSQDGTVVLWDPVTGRELGPLLRGDPSKACGVAFSPDGTRMVTRSLDRRATIWDARSGDKQLDLDLEPQRLCPVSFSPDGTRVLTSDTHGAATISDASTGETVATLRGPDMIVWSAAYSPDGTRIVTANQDGSAHIWDVARGVELTTLCCQPYGPVWFARFSPDGRYVATVGNSDARLWDASTGGYLRSFVGHVDVVTSVAFSPDGTRLATAGHDNTARVWDVTSGAQLMVLRGHSGGIRDVVFSPDGAQLVTASSDRTARIWDAALNAELVTIDAHDGDIAGLAFSRAGGEIVTAGDDRVARVWEVASGRLLAALVGHQKAVTSAAFSPDDSRVVTTGADGSARIWDAASGAQVQLLAHPDAQMVRAATFSPDGRRVATSGDDGYARIWDVAAGTRIDLYETGDVRSVAFSPDGTALASGGTDGRVVLWDASSGAKRAELRPGATVRSVRYSPDGKELVTAGGNNLAEVWDATSGERLLAVAGHAAPLWSATFSPDGRRLLTSGEDGTARLWDAADGRPLLVLRNPTGPVRRAAFSPDGTRLALAHADGTVRIAGGCEITCSFDDLVELGRRRLAGTGRTLSQEERDQFLPPALPWPIVRL